MNTTSSLGSLEPLDISVPFAFREEASFEQGVADLRRLREEFGVRRVFITGCPGLGVRITGWSDDLAPYERFGDLLARVREAVADTGLEVGWWNTPTVSIAKNGPFQFMVGRGGAEDVEIMYKSLSLAVIYLDDVMASTYAGMSFSVAGNGAVHAMSYPLGALYHVPHGESNYAMFTGVMKNYLEIRTDGEMAKVVRYLSYLLRCEEKDAFDQLDKLTGRIRPKKALHEYGMTREQIEEFTDSVIANQQRLLANSFVPFDRDRFIKVYTELF